MGKTEKGAVWLNRDLFSPYEYWQFWRNTDDRDVKRFLNFFTEIAPNKIDEVCTREKNINKLTLFSYVIRINLLLYLQQLFVVFS